jgi:hypothetical protein
LLVDNILAIDKDQTLGKLIEAEIMPKGPLRADLKNAVGDWHDGHFWGGKGTVCKPWSIVNFFINAQFGCCWLRSGSSSFVASLIRRGGANFDFTRERCAIAAEGNATDPTSLTNLEALLFQTGYLTVRNIILGKPKLFGLRAPNKEVSAAVVPPLLGRPEPKRHHAAEALAIEARDSLVSGDMERFQKSFGLFLAQFPLPAQEANKLYCRKLFHMAMVVANFGAATQTGEPRALLGAPVRGKSGGDWAVGLKVQSEEKNSKGECPRPPESPSEEAELRDTLAPLVREALAQIRQPADWLNLPGRVFPAPAGPKIRRETGGPAPKKTR